MDVYVFIEHVSAAFPGDVAGLPHMAWANRVVDPDYAGLAIFKGVSNIQHDVIDPLSGLHATGLHVANAQGAGPYGIKSIRRPATGFVRVYTATGQADAVRDAACDISSLIAAEAVVHQAGDTNDYDVLVDVNGDTITPVKGLVDQVRNLPNADRKPPQVAWFPAAPSS